ncbi:MAG: hypothetical protein Q4A37_00655 [Candidatus Saccharibacteria bacterium]|nr:hypothetical protein [Candidatus Saccharibacteria bacterium]
MINLLPPDAKRQIRAGQSNVLLLRYCIATLMLAVVLAIAIVGVYYVITVSQRTTEQEIQKSNQKIASYQESQREYVEFSSNLATAKTIIDKDVRYSIISQKIGQALPANVVLESLALDATKFGTPLVLNARGKSYDDAIALKTKFEKSSLFDDVHLVSVARAASENTTGDYPISIAISVVIRQEVAKQYE